MARSRAAPDTATVTAGVTTRPPTAAAALAANSSRMKAVFAALKKLGVPEKNIQTVEFLGLAAIHQWRQQQRRAA